MQFSQHALEKCALYGVNPEQLLQALNEGQTFLDLNRGGSRARVFFLTNAPLRPVGPEDDGCS